MRNISYALTTDQFIDGSKSVTRRDGWLHARVGMRVMGCEKCQGIKKGELNRLGAVEFTRVNREPLNQMILDPKYGEIEVIREGFPEMSPKDFVTMFCDHHKGIDPTSLITRLEFIHVDLHQEHKEKCPRCFGVHEKETVYGSGELYCPKCSAMWFPEEQAEGVFRLAMTKRELFNANDV